MIKSLLIAMVLVVASIASSQAHCGSCGHKDEKGKCEQKDGKKGDCDDKDAKKNDEKK